MEIPSINELDLQDGPKRMEMLRDDTGIGHGISRRSFKSPLQSIPTSQCEDPLFSSFPLFLFLFFLIVFPLPQWSHFPLPAPYLRQVPPYGPPGYLLVFPLLRTWMYFPESCLGEEGYLFSYQYHNPVWHLTVVTGGHYWRGPRSQFQDEISPAGLRSTL